jgi:hypothetical protein
MGRLEEIEKYWPVLFPDEQRDTFLRDAVLIANRDIRFLLSEVHRLMTAFEKYKKKAMKNIPIDRELDFFKEVEE